MFKKKVKTQAKIIASCLFLFSLTHFNLSASDHSKVKDHCESSLQSKRKIQLAQDQTWEERFLIRNPAQKEPLDLDITTDSKNSLFILRKKSGVWNSTAGENDLNPQFDPRLVIKNIGQTAARYFKFSYDPQNEVLILPLPEHYSTRIVQANTDLRAMGSSRRIYISYEGIVGKQDRDIYLENFAFKQILPITINDPILQIHDYAYHACSILIPHEVLNLAQLQVKYALLWIKYFEQNNPKLYTKNKTLISALKLEMAENKIDFGSGNFSGSLANDESGYHSGYETLASKGFSPVDFLLHQLKTYLYIFRKKGTTNNQDVLDNYYAFRQIHAEDSEYFEGLNWTQDYFDAKVNEIKNDLFVIGFAWQTKSP